MAPETCRTSASRSPRPAGPPCRSASCCAMHLLPSARARSAILAWVAAARRRRSPARRAAHRGSRRDVPSIALEPCQEEPGVVQLAADLGGARLRLAEPRLDLLAPASHRVPILAEAARARLRPAELTLQGADAPASLRRGRAVPRCLLPRGARRAGLALPG